MQVIPNPGFGPLWAIAHDGDRTAVVVTAYIHADAVAVTEGRMTVRELTAKNDRIKQRYE